MDSISIRTAEDFISPSDVTKRKKHSSVACENCRRLKAKCEGGQPALDGSSLSSRPCVHCVSSKKSCTWPGEDRRKRQRISNAESAQKPPGLNRTTSSRESGSISTDTQFVLSPKTNQNSSIGSENDSIRNDRKDQVQFAEEKPSNSSDDEPALSQLHYYKYLGATAIAPGHKKVSVKVRRGYGAASRNKALSDDPLYSDGEAPQDPLYKGRPSLFDNETGLPTASILPHLLDVFFEYYGSNFCFLNRRYLDYLIRTGEASPFLICAISALSARFCKPERLSPSFNVKGDGQKRERWEFCLPFLERAKRLLMPLLSIPSIDVVAGMLFLAWAEFGDNNEAGLWMFSGMALRMAQDLGLHRQHTSLSSSIAETPAHIIPSKNDLEISKSLSPPNWNSVDMESFERSSRILLFWCLFTNDTCLSSGTGRVPSIKREEVSIRQPEDTDIAVIRAGPGNVLGPVNPTVYPALVRMMLLFAPSLEFLNTSNYQKVDTTPPRSDFPQRLLRAEELRENIIRQYEKLPRELKCGAIFYKAAAKSNQAGPYLVLHLFYQLQIVFLTQESLAAHGVSPSERANKTSVVEEAPTTSDSIEHETSAKRNKNEELYQHAIRSISDLLTVAKLIDSRTLNSTFWLDQSFFHAACAYVYDMQHPKHRLQTFQEGESTTFPIPSHTSPSMVLHVKDYEEGSAAESTLQYLALLAKTNYHFLRQSIKDMMEFYAGAGWLDAVLDQRETGLRDVDLSIVSEKISTYIRLHDLRRRHVPKVAPAAEASSTNDGAPPPSDLVPNDTVLGKHSADFLADAELGFDPQAFFDEYMFEESAMHDQDRL